MNQSEFLKYLKNKFERKKTILFVGAGISLNSGLPIVYGKDGLIPTILRTLNVEEDDIKELLSYQYPFEAFIAIIKKHVDIDVLLSIFKEGIPNTTHLLISSLLKDRIVDTVLTTNFDLLIERAYSVIAKKELLVVSQTNQFDNISWDNSKEKLIKIHGCISEIESIAITLNQVSMKGLIEARSKVLRHLFNPTSTESNTILILGYSASDIFDLIPSIISMSNRNAEILFVNHSFDSTFKVVEIHKVDNIKTGELRSTDSISATNNPFAEYSGYWICMNTDELVLNICAELDIPNRGINKYRSNWSQIVDLWGKSLTLKSKSYIGSQLFNEICNYEKSKNYVHQEFLRNPDFQSYINSLNISGIEKHRTGDFHGALKDYNELMNLDIPDDGFNAQLFENTSKLHNELGEFESSIDLIEKAFMKFKLLEDEQGQIRCRRTYANSLVGLKQFENALRLAYEAVEMCMDIGDKKSEAYSRIAVSRCLKELRRFEESVAELLLVKTLGEKLDDNYILATAYNNMTAVCINAASLGNVVNLKEALSFCQKSIELCTIINDQHSLMLAFENFRALMLIDSITRNDGNK